MTFAYSQNMENTTEEVVPYPFEKFQKQEEIENKIQNSMVQLSCFATPLPEVIEEWKIMTEIPIVLSPHVYLYRTDQQLRLT